MRLLEPSAPLWIEVGSPAAEDLRVAYSVSVRNVDDGTVVTSDPVFHTAIGGQVIATDLPSELLSLDARDILGALAEVALNVQQLAAEQGQTVPEVWKSVVAATMELGAPSVEAAATLVQAARQEEKEPVPV
jgi:hypothetical protein